PVATTVNVWFSPSNRVALAGGCVMLGGVAAKAELEPIIATNAASAGHPANPPASGCWTRSSCWNPSQCATALHVTPLYSTNNDIRHAPTPAPEGLRQNIYPASILMRTWNGANPTRFPPICKPGSRKSYAGRGQSGFWSGPMGLATRNPELGAGTGRGRSR